MTSVDTLEDNTKFAEMHGADFPILADPTRQTARAYGVIPEGRDFASRWTFYIGPDGKILYIDKQVSPSTHGKAVAAKLAELGVPRRRS